MADMKQANAAKSVPEKIICAGIPRSGTTMMFRALAGLKAGATTPQDYKGPIRKTHSFRPRSFKKCTKAIFLFGDPVASVVSTREKRYMSRHFENCGAGDRDPETTDIYREDALNYTKMFNAWTRRQPFDLLLARYETLYENLPVIEGFFGRQLNVPPHRPRKTDPGETVSPDDLKAIRKTYEKLIKRIESAPDITIFSASS